MKRTNLLATYRKQKKRNLRRRCTLELAYFKDCFPSCSRSHYHSSFSTLQAKPASGSISQNYEEKIRPEGLSYFIQNVEQKLQIQEYDVESMKIQTKGDIKVNISNSARKKSQKFNPAQKAIVRARQLFLRKGGNVIFNFQHYASPEKVLREYARVNIYNKNRLSRIDKKEISEAVYSLHDVQLTSYVDLRDSKLNFRSKHENDEKRKSARRSKVKRNINTDDACSKIKLARSWQPVKRIPATNNFVYEFNPFDNIQNDDSSKGLRKSQESLNPCGSTTHCSKGVPISKSTTNIKKDVEKVKVHSTATLPKLKSNPDSTVNVFERPGKSIYLEGETTLPFIRKTQERTKNQVIFQESEKICKTRPARLNVIDRNVGNVQSNFQRYRKNHVSNPCSVKLYNTLERATREIDRIEKSIDLIGNRYLQKNATKLSKDSESIAECDVERSGNPTRFSTKRDCWPNFESISTTDTNFPIRDHVEEVDKKGKKEIIKQRSLFTKKRLWSIDDVFDLDSNILLNRWDKSKRNNEMSAETSVLNGEKSYTAKSNDTFDTIARNKAQERPNFEASIEHVPNTLAVLNLNTPESQKAIEKHNNDDLEYPGCGYGNEITQCLKEDGESVNAKSSGENAYIETGFNGLNISKDVLDQVLQSEYLRKDLLSMNLI